MTGDDNNHTARSDSCSQYPPTSHIPMPTQPWDLKHPKEPCTLPSLWSPGRRPDSGSPESGTDSLPKSLVPFLTLNFSAVNHCPLHIPMFPHITVNISMLLPRCQSSQTAPVLRRHPSRPHSPTLANATHADQSLHLHKCPLNLTTVELRKSLTLLYAVIFPSVRPLAHSRPTSKPTGHPS